MTRLYAHHCRLSRGLRRESPPRIEGLREERCQRSWFWRFLWFQEDGRRGYLGTPYGFPLTPDLTWDRLRPWLDWHAWWYLDILIM